MRVVINYLHSADAANQVVAEIEADGGEAGHGGPGGRARAPAGTAGDPRRSRHEAGIAAGAAELGVPRNVTASEFCRVAKAT
jgi:hypothetical protein